MVINGNQFRDAILSGANHLAANRQMVDELNVFPVPDGDTGTNMTLTMKSATREVVNLEDCDITEVADMASSALLRGARGNSGVILSLLFRGIAQGFKGHKQADGIVIAHALQCGVDAAYKAVMKPTEGTILTVARIAAEQAQKASAKQNNAVKVFESAYKASLITLEKTPELLPVLKKSGVVDAGGKGLTLIFEGMLSVLKNGQMIPDIDSEESTAVSRNAAAEWEGEITYTYCTEFIIKREVEPPHDPLVLRAYLETLGDSVVVVDDEQIIKVHLHTDHPGKVIEQALLYGPLINLKIDNMRDQHERARHDAAEFRENDERELSEEQIQFQGPAPQTNAYGFVAVAAGDGLHRLFKDLGVDNIVSGGQTMNPSTEDLLEAVERTPAQTVFILPNNKNIIMAAEQVIPLATRKVIVLHSRFIPMGISAMLAFDPTASAEENAIQMDSAMHLVSTGQVTYAARDSDFDGHNIKQGEILALENGKLSFTEQDIEKAVLRLMNKLYKKSSMFITIIYGKDVDGDAAEKIRDTVKKRFTGVEVTLVNGGQPVYYYILSVE